MYKDFKELTKLSTDELVTHKEQLLTEIVNAEQDRQNLIANILYLQNRVAELRIEQ